MVSIKIFLPCSVTTIAVVPEEQGGAEDGGRGRADDDERDAAQE